MRLAEMSKGEEEAQSGREAKGNDAEGKVRANVGTGEGAKLGMG